MVRRHVPFRRPARPALPTSRAAVRRTVAALLLGLLTAGCDESGSGSTAAPNLAPQALDAAVEVPKNESLVVDLVATDPDGDALTFRLTVEPAHGSVTLDDTGAAPRATYVPAADFVGADAFTWEASDGEAVDAGTVTVEVFNRPPESSAPEVVTRPATTGGAVEIEVSATDPDGDPLTFEVTTAPAHGTLSEFRYEGDDGGAPTAGPAAADGATHGSVTYTPDDGFSGSDGFGFRSTDGESASEEAFVSVDVNAVPEAMPLSVTVGRGEAVEIELSGADADGHPLTFEIVEGPGSGSLSAVTPVDGATARVTYVPGDGHPGTDAFSYRAHDSFDPSGPAGVELTLENEAPQASDGAVTVPEETGTPLELAASDPDGDALVFTVVSAPEHGGISAVTITGSGTAELAYTPDVDYVGPDALTFMVADAFGLTAHGTITIDVVAVNDAPTFEGGPDMTVLEDAGPQEAAGWATDVDAGEAGQALTFVVTGNSNEALFAAPPAVGVDGTLTFTPADEASGSADVTLTLVDDGGTDDGGDDTSEPYTFTILVEPVNDAPSFAAGPSVVVLEGSGAYEEPWAAELSAGPLEDQGLAFEVSGNSLPDLFSEPPTLTADGRLAFAPVDNVGGSSEITVRLLDDGGTENGGDDASEETTFTITVVAVNDPPSFAGGDDVATDEDAGPQTVEGWATDILAGPPDEAAQAVSFEVTGNTDPDLFAASPAVSADGTLTYTPADDAFGTATITVVLSDDGGTDDDGDDTADAHDFTIEVRAVNDAPTFMGGDPHSVAEDSPAQTLVGWATDVFPGATNEEQALSFTVTHDGDPGFFAEGPAVDAAGTLTYTPGPDAFGTVEVTVRLVDDGGTANGGGDTSDPWTFDIHLTPVQDAPVATAQAVATDEDVPLVITLSGIDPDGDDLIFAVPVGPTKGSLGTIQKTGLTTATVEYTPDPESEADDAFTFSVRDASATSDAVAVSVDVVPTNDRPTVSIDGTLVTQPGGAEPDEITVNVNMDPVQDVTYDLADVEALNEHGDARAPYYFRIAPLSWPEAEAKEGAEPPDPFAWRNFDPDDIASDGVLVPPDFDTGNGGYIQFSSSIGVAAFILHGLELETAVVGEYVLEITVIDNGFLGTCPEGLVEPDPAELDGFDAQDYRKAIGREGDLLAGDPFRCIRETPTLVRLNVTGFGNVARFVKAGL